MLKTSSYLHCKYIILRGALFFGGLFAVLISSAPNVQAAPSYTACPWASGDYTLPGNYSLVISATAYDCTGVNLTIPNGVTLTMGSNPSLGQYAKLLLNNLTVETGGLIESNGLGYSRSATGNGTGPGAGTCAGSSCGGGGYGGAGGVGSSGGTGGSTYGDANAPTDWGSAGGGSGAGSAGGGIVYIVVTNDAIVNGSITASGSSTSASAGGSGGSIYITTDTISGTGYVAARGANGFMAGSISTGGGGGGRIAIISNDNSDDTITYRANGGIRAGSVGGSNGVYGTVIDGAPRTVSTTIAPTNPHDYDNVTLSATARDANGVDYITIFLDSTDPGASQFTCNLAAPESGTCDWSVGTISAGSHQMIVRAVGEDTLQSEQSFAFNVTGSSGSSFQRICDTFNINLSTPNGGESLLPGSSYGIFWGVSGCDFNGVSLWLSTDDGQTFDYHIADVGYATNGYYDWTVPTDINSNQAKIKAELIGKSVSDVSDSSFTIGFPTVLNSVLPITVVELQPEPQPEPEPIFIEPTPALIFEPEFIPILFYAPPIINVIEHQQNVIEAVEAIEAIALTPGLEAPIVQEIQSAVLEFSESKADYNEYSQEMVANINKLTANASDTANAGQSADLALDLSQLMTDIDLAMAQALLDDGYVPDDLAPRLVESISALQTEYDRLNKLEQEWQEKQNLLDTQLEEALAEAVRLRELEDESVVLSDITIMYAEQLAELRLEQADINNKLGLAEQELRDLVVRLLEKQLAYDTAVEEVQLYIEEIAKIEFGKSLWDPIFTPAELATRDAWQKKYNEASVRVATLKNEIREIELLQVELEQQIDNYKVGLERIGADVNVARMSLEDAMMITNHKFNVATGQRDVVQTVQEDVAETATELQVANQQVVEAMNANEVFNTLLEEQVNLAIDESFNLASDTTNEILDLLEEGDPEYVETINACATALQPAVLGFFASNGATLANLDIDALADYLEANASSYAPCTKVALGKVKLVKLASVYIFGEGNLVAETIDATFEHAFGVAGEVVNNAEDLFAGAMLAAMSGDTAYLQYAAQETVDDVMNYAVDEILPDVVTTAVQLAEEVDMAIKNPAVAVQRASATAVKVTENVVNTVIKIFCLGPWC